MAKGKDSFSIGRTRDKDNGVTKPETNKPLIDVKFDDFVDGSVPETTKTFRIPTTLSKQLKVKAAQAGMTEKMVLTKLIEAYVGINS